MRNRKNIGTHILLGILFIWLYTCKPEVDVVSHSKSDPALAWNTKIINLAIEKDGLLTLNGVRTEAMAFLAMHNALNAIHPRYTSYQFSGTYSNAHPEVAISQAAFEVTLRCFPEKEKELRDLLNQILSKIPESETKNSGIRLGKATANDVLKIRTNDKWNGEAAYTWHPMAPGVYAEFNEHSGTPEGFVFGAGWAQATPFMLKKQDQFRSPPPPNIRSEDYTKAFNEVKKYGSTHSPIRSDDQTHLALWWKEFVEKSHNKLARELIRKEELNLWETVRTLALLNTATYDAYINVFNNKFHYNHWRPFTAIRWAAHDENPNTEADKEWDNLHRHTYPFPSYPSAHGTASSAAMRILSNALGKGDKYTFTMTTEKVESAGPFSEKIQMNPPTRSFTSFTQAGLEASMSRVYLGIHFRYDSEEGHRLGNSIGDYINENFLLSLDKQSQKE